MVRGIDDGLVRPRRTGELADHVRPLEPPTLERHREVGRHGQFLRLEVARGGLLLPCFQRRPAHRGELLGDGFGDPAFELERVLGRRCELDLLAARAIREHGEGVACHRLGVDEEDAGRAAPPGLFVLVRPAPVVRQRVGLEEARLLGRRRWVVDERDEHLAAHVHVFVVVPLVAWICDAVADEHEGGVERGRIGVEVGRGDEVVHEVECDGLAGSRA